MANVRGRTKEKHRKMRLKRALFMALARMADDANAEFACLDDPDHIYQCERRRKGNKTFYRMVTKVKNGSRKR